MDLPDAVVQVVEHLVEKLGVYHAGLLGSACYRIRVVGGRPIAVGAYDCALCGLVGQDDWQSGLMFFQGVMAHPCVKIALDTTSHMALRHERVRNYDMNLTLTASENLVRRLLAENQQGRVHLDAMHQLLSEQTDMNKVLQGQLEDMEEGGALSGVIALCSRLLVQMDILTQADSLFSLIPEKIHVSKTEIDQITDTLDHLPKPAETTSLYRVMSDMYAACIQHKNYLDALLQQLPFTADSTAAGTLMNSVVEHNARLFLTGQGIASTASDWETKVDMVMRQLSPYHQYTAWERILFEPFKFATPELADGDDITSIGHYTREGCALLHPNRNSKLCKMSVVWARLSMIGFKIMSEHASNV